MKALVRRELLTEKRIRLIFSKFFKTFSERKEKSSSTRSHVVAENDPSVKFSNPGVAKVLKAQLRGFQNNSKLLQEEQGVGGG